MCVDLPGAASQVPVPEQQLDHIARRREVSGFVIVSVALAHPNRHPVPALVVHAHLRQPPLQSPSPPPRGPRTSDLRLLTDKFPREAHPVADTARPLLAVTWLRRSHLVEIPLRHTPWGVSKHAAGLNVPWFRPGHCGWTPTP